MEHEPEVLTESPQLSEDESSESDEDSETPKMMRDRFTKNGLIKEQPKNNIQMMAVMFMDALLAGST